MWVGRCIWCGVKCLCVVASEWSLNGCSVAPGPVCCSSVVMFHKQWQLWLPGIVLWTHTGSLLSDYSQWLTTAYSVLLTSWDPPHTHGGTCVHVMPWCGGVVGASWCHGRGVWRIFHVV